MMLEAQNISVGYGKQEPVVSDVSLKLMGGEIMVLVGPNGSGKSTILRALAASLLPGSGQVCLDGKPLGRYSKKILAREIAYLPQSPLVPDDFTVRDLVSYGRNPHLKWNGCMTKEDWLIVDEAIERTRLEDLQYRFIASLSGGERQRAWLALALVQKAKILLLDEPTTFLDITYQFDVLELVGELNKSLGLSAVMVLHDLNQAIRYGHSITVLNEGKIVANGPPAKVITTDLLASVFKIRTEIIQDHIYGWPYIVPLSSLRNKSNPLKWK